MTRLLRAAVAAALLAVPVALTPAAHAACYLAGQDPVSAYWCTDMGWLCAGASAGAVEVDACRGYTGQTTCHARVAHLVVTCTG